MQNHPTAQAEARNSRAEVRFSLPQPLLAGLLCVTALLPCRLPAQTNNAKVEPSNRCLFIVETSQSMQRRRAAVLKTLQDLLTSGLNGQLRRGDTLGLWTFNEDLYAGRFPLQAWSPDAKGEIASRMVAFLKAQKYEKQVRFDRLWPALDHLIANSRNLTVILVSSGDGTIRGTPFDDRINESYQLWHDQQQKARMPFITVLCGRDRQLAAFVVSTPPWPLEIPRLPEEAQTAAPPPSKPPQAARKAPPPIAPPLIISGKKHASEQATASTPTPAAIKAEAPAAATAPTAAGESAGSKPLEPAAPPVQIASAKAEPATVGQFPAQVPQKAAPAPTPMAEPNAQSVKASESGAAEPAAPKPDAAPPLGAPAPTPAPVAVELPKPAATPETKPVPVTSAAPPASAPTPGHAPSPASPPLQSATAVPAETVVRHTSLWVGGVVLVIMAGGFSLLLLRRRPRATPQGSLITQSIERGKKP